MGRYFSHQGVLDLLEGIDFCGDSIVTTTKKLSICIFPKDFLETT